MESRAERRTDDRAGADRHALAVGLHLRHDAAGGVAALHDQREELAQMREKLRELHNASKWTASWVTQRLEDDFPFLADGGVEGRTRADVRDKEGCVRTQGRRHE